MIRISESVVLRRGPSDICMKTPAEALAVCLLGQVTVRSGLTTLDAGVWKRKKAKSLLAFLALQRGQAVHRDVIVSKLWPGIDAKVALSHFNAAFHALRQALQQEREGSAQLQHLLYLDSQCQLALGPGGYLDVDLFEKRLRASSVGDIDHKIFYLERAFELYKGELLCDLQQEKWCRAERERLRELYYASLERLAEMYESKRDFDSALDCYRLVLAEDGCREEVHRAVINLYVKTHRWADAVEQYRKCATVLRDAFGIGPAQATTLAYESALARQEALLIEPFVVSLSKPR